VLHVAVELAVAELAALGLVGARRALDPRVRDAPVQPLGLGERLVGADVADDDEHRVVRAVDVAIEAQQVGLVELSQPGLPLAAPPP